MCKDEAYSVCSIGTKEQKTKLNCREINNTLNKLLSESKIEINATGEYN